MMTLILIMILSALAAVFLSQGTRMNALSEKAFSHSVAMVQIGDLERQLPSLFSAINGAEQLDIAMRIPLQIESKEGDFLLKGRLSSLYGRFNINRIARSDGNVSQPEYEVLGRLFQRYPIGDQDLFFKIVFDTIDLDLGERGYETEIAVRRPDFKNGSIENFAQFTMILERYVELSRDKTILAIPWERYIGYEGEKMDFNAVNAEVLPLVVPSISPEQARVLTQYRTKAYATKEEVIAAEPSLGSVFDTYFFIYKSGLPYKVALDVDIRERGMQRQMRLRYDLMEKKADRVEYF